MQEYILAWVSQGNKMNVETDAKKVHNQNNSLLLKNPQFLPNINETWLKLPAHDS